MPKILYLDLLPKELRVELNLFRTYHKISKNDITYFMFEHKDNLEWSNVLHYFIDTKQETDYQITLEEHGKVIMGLENHILHIYGYVIDNYKFTDLLFMKVNVPENSKINNTIIDGPMYCFIINVTGTGYNCCSSYDFYMAKTAKELEKHIGKYKKELNLETINFNYL